jgi:hypothetical protein
MFATSWLASGEAFIRTPNADSLTSGSVACCRIGAENKKKKVLCPTAAKS